MGRGSNVDAVVRTRPGRPLPPSTVQAACSTTTYQEAEEELMLAEQARHPMHTPRQHATRATYPGPEQALRAPCARPAYSLCVCVSVCLAGLSLCLVPSWLRCVCAGCVPRCARVSFLPIIMFSVLSCEYMLSTSFTPDREGAVFIAPTKASFAAVCSPRRASAAAWPCTRQSTLGLSVSSLPPRWKSITGKSTGPPGH